MKPDDNLIPNDVVAKDDSENKMFKFNGTAAIIGLSGITAILAGFISAHVAKKRSDEFFKKLGREQIPQAPLESPYALAFKALALGTVWAVGGVSLIMFGVWKWYGAKDFQDFKTRLRSNIKKSPPTDERTEFDSLKDFINYINEKYQSEKAEKSKKNT